MTGHLPLKLVYPFSKFVSTSILHPRIICFLGEKSMNKIDMPVLNVKMVPIGKIKSNNYNLNNVAELEMELLKLSDFRRWLYTTNCLLS